MLVAVAALRYMHVAQPHLPVTTDAVNQTSLFMGLPPSTHSLSSNTTVQW